MAERPAVGGRTFALGCGAVLGTEIALVAGAAGGGYPLAVLGLVRLSQAVLLGVIAARGRGGLASVGIAAGSLTAGIKRGIVWSAGFGAVVAAAAAALLAAGIDPLPYIRADLPSGPGDLFWLFAVGGVVGPLAEEFFFRGFLFGYCRRWGFVPALLVSTVLFAAAHSGFGAVYPPHVISGLLLAAAYEREKNLAVPMTIHAAANLAIFTLSTLG